MNRNRIRKAQAKKLTAAALAVLMSTQLCAAPITAQAAGSADSDKDKDNTESQKEKTAIFIAATVLMGEFLCGCYQQGIPLSDRFTIAGYDTYHFSPFATSPISVIEQPIIEVGKLATERLLEQISAQGALPIQEIILKCKLSLR